VDQADGARQIRNSARGLRFTGDKAALPLMRRKPNYGKLRPMARKPPADAPPPPFAGFGAGALPFFADLAANQTRDWFLEHRADYERDVKGPLGSLVHALAFAFAAHDIPLTGDARRSLFRLNRDVRFSNNKAPYKTNAGAVMTRDGTKNTLGMLYVQIGGDEGSFMAVGFYGAEPKDLAALRHGVADRAEQWLEVVAELAEAGLAPSMGHALTRLPKGFEDHAGSPIADALKMRNFVVSRPIAPPDLERVELIDDIVAFTAAALPLLRFGWSALDRARGAAEAIR